MRISPGSFLICLLTVIILTGYVFFIIYVKKDILYEGMKFTFGAIALILLRMMIPVNFPFTVTIPFSEVLPTISRMIFYRINGGNIRIVHILVAVWLVEAMRRLLRMYRENRNYRRSLEPFRVNDLSDYPVVKEVLEEYNLLSLPVCIVPVSISPEIFGAWNSILVLPELDVREDEWRYICRHEVEHYINHDVWLKLVVDLAVCIQWFNPLVYLMQEELILAFEMSNDYKVLRGCNANQRLDYSECIVKIAKLLNDNSAKHTSLSFIKVHDMNIMRRIQFLLSKSYGETKRRGLSVFLRYILVIVMLVVSFVFVPEGYIPENIEDNEVVKVHEDNSYIKRVEGGYELYVNGVYLYTCSTIHEEFSDLPIIEEEDAK